MTEKDEERKIQIKLIEDLIKQRKEDLDNWTYPKDLSVKLKLPENKINYNLHLIRAHLYTNTLAGNILSDKFDSGVKIKDSGLSALERLKKKGPISDPSPASQEKGFIKSVANQKFFDLVLSILLGISLTQFLSFFLSTDIPVVWGIIFSVVIILFYLSIVYYLLMVSDEKESTHVFLSKVTLSVLIIYWPYATQKLWTVSMSYVGGYLIIMTILFSAWRYLDSKKFDSSVFIGIVLLVIAIIFTCLTIFPFPQVTPIGGV